MVKLHQLEGQLLAAKSIRKEFEDAIRVIKDSSQDLQQDTIRDVLRNIRAKMLQLAALQDAALGGFTLEQYKYYEKLTGDD